MCGNYFINLLRLVPVVQAINDSVSAISKIHDNKRELNNELHQKIFNVMFQFGSDNYKITSHSIKLSQQLLDSFYIQHLNLFDFHFDPELSLIQNLNSQLFQ